MLKPRRDTTFFRERYTLLTGLSIPRREFRSHRSFLVPTSHHPSPIKLAKHPLFLTKSTLLLTNPTLGLPIELVRNKIIRALFRSEVFQVIACETMAVKSLLVV